MRSTGLRVIPEAAQLAAEETCNALWSLANALVPLLSLYLVCVWRERYEGERSPEVQRPLAGLLLGLSYESLAGILTMGSIVS